MVDARIYIVVVKALEAIIEGYSNELELHGLSRPNRHVDGWTVINLFSSLVLGFVFPTQIYFMFYVAVIAQLVIHFTNADHGAIWSHVLIKVIANVFGYALGSLLRLGKLDIKL